MAERVLSAMSQRVLEELTSGPKAVTKGTFVGTYPKRAGVRRGGC
jgi:hypothetical protein